MRRLATALLGLLLIPGSAAAQAEDGDAMSWHDYDSLSREVWRGATEARALSSDGGTMTLDEAEAVLTEALVRLERVVPMACYRSYHQANTLALANHRMSIRMAIESRTDTAEALTAVALTLAEWLVDETPRVVARCVQADEATDQDDPVSKGGEHSRLALSPDVVRPQTGGVSAR